MALEKALGLPKDFARDAIIYESIKCLSKTDVHKKIDIQHSIDSLIFSGDEDLVYLGLRCLSECHLNGYVSPRIEIATCIISLFNSKNESIMQLVGFGFDVGY
jgi:hypothetical protein